MISTILTDPKQLLKQFGTSPCKINDLVLDVVVSEGIDFAWTTADYKTQSGYTPSDVRRKDRVKLNLECVFVDKTYGVSDVIQSELTGSGYSPETFRDKYKSLKELADSEDIVTVVLGLDTFSNMSIKNIGIIRDKDRAGYLSFSMSLEEIPIVDIDFDEVDTSLMPKDGQETETKKEQKKKAKKADKKKSQPKQASESERGSTLYGIAY